MKKPIKLSTNYIIKTLYNQELYYFTLKDIASLFNIPINKAYTLAIRLKDKDLIRPIERGKYLLLGFEPERVLSNPFFIASRIVYPSYVSFISALNFYGFTEQVPSVVLLVSLRKKTKIDFNGFRFRYIMINQRKFFGYKKEKVGELDFLIADEEKAVIDSLDLPDNAGGMIEVAKALYNASGKIDLNELFKYATAMKNKSMCSRLGYLLERFDIDADELLEYASDEYIKLDPRKKKTQIWDKKWRTNVNLNDEDLFGWRRT